MITTAPAKTLKEWEQEIRDFSNLEKGWDSYDAEPPSQAAIENAVKVLQGLGIGPKLVVPTSDGSILMEYLINDTRYQICFEYDGDITLTRTKDGETTHHDFADDNNEEVEICESCRS